MRKSKKKCFLFVGLSLLIVTIAYAKALEEPCPPREPEVTDWNEYSCEVKYKAPHNDGGSPIFNYIIERKFKYDGYWSIAAETKCDTFKCYVPDLMEGLETEIRVRAENKAGIGEASRETATVIPRRK